MAGLYAAALQGEVGSCAQPLTQQTAHAAQCLCTVLGHQSVLGRGDIEDERGIAPHGLEIHSEEAFGAECLFAVMVEPPPVGSLGITLARQPEPSALGAFLGPGLVFTVETIVGGPVGDARISALVTYPSGLATHAPHHAVGQ